MSGPGDEANEGSPYLHDSDDAVEHRRDDQANPSEWDCYRENPNQGLVDMPESIDDPTDLEWMD